MSDQQALARAALRAAGRARSQLAGARSSLCLCLLVAIALMGGCSGIESRLLSTPRSTWDTPERAREVWIDLADGGRLHGWLFLPQSSRPLEDAEPEQTAARLPLPAVLYLHGRADSMALYREAAPVFSDAIGVALLMVDYRGWGKSSQANPLGRRSLLDDARAALAHLRAMPEVDDQRIALWGASMGGHPATALFAEEAELAALVLWASPADSKRLLADHRRRLGFAAYTAGAIGLRRWREPRHEIAGATGRPVLIVHGLLDGVVPIGHGVTLHNTALAAGARAEWYSDLSGHEGLSPGARNRIEEFLRTHLGLSGAPALLREAIDAIATHALGRERHDWAAVERDLRAGLDPGLPPSAAHEAIGAAVARLGDAHARFIALAEPTPDDVPGQLAQAPQADESPPPAGPAAPSIPLTPRGRVLDDGTAYLVVPGCYAPDTEALRDWARAACDEVSRLAALAPRGWLIDLRLNGGGNLWPMLLGLEPLLGDGVLMTMVAGNGAGQDGAATRVQSGFGVGDHDGSTAAWIEWGSQRIVQLDWAGQPPPALAVPLDGRDDSNRDGGSGPRVAVLLGPWTMSSGEALALCLLSRAGTRSFGEPTAGLTTVTQGYALSDGSMLILPVSLMGDAAGRAIHGPLAPMNLVPFASWPDADDAAARAARAWLGQRER